MSTSASGRGRNSKSFQAYQRPGPSKAAPISRGVTHETISTSGRPSAEIAPPSPAAAAAAATAASAASAAVPGAAAAPAMSPTLRSARAMDSLLSSRASSSNVAGRVGTRKKSTRWPEPSEAFGSADWVKDTSARRVYRRTEPPPAAPATSKGCRLTRGGAAEARGAAGSGAAPAAAAAAAAAAAVCRAAVGTCRWKLDGSHGDPL